MVILFLQHTKQSTSEKKHNLCHLFSFLLPFNLEQFVLGIFDQQTAYEVLGQLTGAAEILLVKVIVDSGDVCQGLLLGFAQKRRSAAQPTGSQTQGFIKTQTRSDLFCYKCQQAAMTRNTTHRMYVITPILL